MKQDRLSLRWPMAMLMLMLITVNLFSHISCQSARTITLPLTRTTTPAAGIFGQPVMSYYVQANIGTPAKVYNVQFDVGLGDSWLPHYEWSPFKVNIHYSKGYQCKVSSTCVKKDRSYVIEYQNCKLTGKPYEDIITFSNVMNQNRSHPINQVSMRHNFLAMSDASDARFRDLPVDGFFGLAPQSTTPVENILVGLQKNNLIDNLQFSLWFSPVLDATHGGAIILGGVDTNKYQGQIYWHPSSTSHKQAWSLNLQYVSLGNQVISCDKQKCEAVLSSGVNEVFGPPADVQRIYHLLSTTRQGNLELVDCRRINQMPVLVFTIDGSPLPLLPTNYVRKTVSGKIFKEETCYVAILPSTNGQKEWVLGTNFLGAYYTVFDMTYGQVGFATLK